MTQSPRQQPDAHPQASSSLPAHADAASCELPMTEGPAAPATWPPAVEALAHPLGSSPAPTTLAELTTLRVGGPVREYLEASTEAEIIDAVRGVDAAGTPVLVIGGGSNILAADAGFDGLVIRDARTQVRLLSDDRCGGVEVQATAGTTWDELVREAVASQWGGFAPLSGIPGTVGAAPVQNIGAYGAEVAELIAFVRAWDRALNQPVHLPLSELALSYRDSALKRSLTDASVGGGRIWGPTGRWVVLQVVFAVRQATLSAPIAYKQLAQALGVELGERAPMREVREAVLALRRSKGMVLDSADHDTWSAGSFFTNPILTAAEAAALPAEAPRFPVADHSRTTSASGVPRMEGLVKTSAAWLIDHAGFSRGWALNGDAGAGGTGSQAAAPAGAGAGPTGGKAGPAASLSTKHVLALTNRGGATAAELAALRDAVVAGVRESYGVTLVPEPVHVGW
ncbi:UDP-N-acetylenolpyruvoylglucosamine reductase [Actinomyces bovis]|uniref:UDP-N-acetylenolpyruvoylglucosamine reductase n=1 Tax=Actinomyces bovis TaxID=1658 RepID=A0ABY1VLJ8_9ACTO|nr:UDP-N-acetylmuramate dehydrogenase [Actinomyces bovis]SPT52981.1 UDP-N-acetylenolpyruvoylglucosamine reductase [Actinomyces bovis]VEG55202.1 UDP-N-acetylenolpyruvoylglucosamine reductase [Actinomyces israelii]